MKFSFELATPSLAAVKLAAPPPAAFTVALAPVAEMEMTLLLVVAQETGRSVSTCPADIGVAIRSSVWPRFNVIVLLAGAPPRATAVTGRRTIGPPPPGVYCS